MKVDIHLKSAGAPKPYTNAKTTYVKEGFYCIQLADGKVHKYPAENIFRVVEDYDQSSKGAVS